MKLDRPLLVLDCETTGLHPARNSVLSLGAVIVNRNLLKTFRMKWDVRLENLFEIFRGEYKRAQKVHGIPTRRALFGGQPVDEVVQDLIGLHLNNPDTLIAGNNVGFDWAFLNRMFEQAERKNPFSYHLVDLTGLAAVHLGVVGLSKIAQALGQDATRYTKHDALGDAELTADCLIALLKAIQATDEYAVKHAEDVGEKAGKESVGRLVASNGRSFSDIAADEGL